MEGTYQLLKYMAFDDDMHTMEEMKKRYYKLYFAANAMRLNLEELRYLVKVLETTDSFTIARGEQIDHPTVSHQKLKDKVKQDIRRLTN